MAADDQKPTSALYPEQIDLRRSFDHSEESLNRASPFAKWEWVRVTFNSTADTDTIIRHHLNPTDPETVLWSAWNHEAMSAPATVPHVYRDTSTGHRTWGDNFIVLRCKVANAKMVLLLTLPRKVSNASQSNF